MAEIDISKQLCKNRGKTPVKICYPDATRVTSFHCNKTGQLTQVDMCVPLLFVVFVRNLTEEALLPIYIAHTTPANFFPGLQTQMFSIMLVFL